MENRNFFEFYHFLKQEFEFFLKQEILTELKKISHPFLFESISYCLNGGKRLRPILTLSSYLLNSNKKEIKQDIFYLACSVECIHSYSLIHDDLPSMDNDDFRRNAPSCHKKFGENIAILTGDALNSYAFFLISKIKNQHSEVLQILHEGAGLSGMISGQMYDMDAEGKINHNRNSLLCIYHKKTAALITAALSLGSLFNPFLSQENVKLLKKYGTNLGFLFQLKDDILDIEGKKENIGKTPGKDENFEKLTYPIFYGLKESKEKMETIKDTLIKISQQLSPNEFFFRDLAHYIVQREN